MGKDKIERVQTGVRMEKSMTKVLKALSEYYDISLGQLLEGIVLHAFHQKQIFDEEVINKITSLKQVYSMDYGIERCKIIHSGEDRDEKNS